MSGKWQTLLIGGAAAAGKSTLAEQIATAEDAEVVHIDDLSVGDLERLRGRPEVWDDPSAVLTLLRKASQDFSPLLKVLVERTLSEGRRVVVEGERIRPDCALELVRAGDGLVEAIFLVEDEPAAIRENLAAKSRAFLALDERRQENVVRVNCNYGLWIEQEAKASRLPVLRPRPWTTLWSRSQLELSRLAVSRSGLVSA